MRINQVIRGTIALPNTNGYQTATATIPTVNVAKSQLEYLGDLGNYIFGTGNVTVSNVYLQLTNATTITAQGNISNATSPAVSYELTEWI